MILKQLWGEVRLGGVTVILPAIEVITNGTKIY